MCGAGRLCCPLSLRELCECALTLCFINVKEEVFRQIQSGCGNLYFLSILHRLRGGIDFCGKANRAFRKAQWMSGTGRQAKLTWSRAASIVWNLLTSNRKRICKKEKENEPTLVVTFQQFPHLKLCGKLSGC